MSAYAKFWRSLRTERGLSQVQIARALRISEQFVSRVERGVCRFSLPQTIRLLKFLDLDPELIIALLLSDQEEILRSAFKKKSCGSDRSK